MKKLLFYLANHKTPVTVVLSLAFLLVFTSAAYAALSFTNDDITSDEDVTMTAVDDVLLTLTSGAAAEDFTISVTGATDSSLFLASSGTGGDALTLSASAGGLLIDSAGVLELNSSGGVIGIGNDAVAQNINIGTGAAARTITIGNNTGATLVNITAGTDGIELTGQLVTKGTAPGATQSAGTPSLTATSTDTAGTVTSDTTSHTTVILTFAAPYTTAPSCTISAGNAAAAVIAGSATGVYAATSTSALTITHAADTTAAMWHYHCIELE